MTRGTNRPDAEGVRYVRAPDDRVVAIYVDGSFDEFEAFPPYLDSPEERAHLEEAYDVEAAAVERRTKAHVTPDPFPLQVVLLDRPEGAGVAPHYHEVTDHPTLPTRHQLMYCQAGAAEIGVYTTEGTFVETVRLEANDLILLAEGHAIEVKAPGTRLIEIKQGPFPETDAADKVEIDVDSA